MENGAVRLPQTLPVQTIDDVQAKIDHIHSQMALYARDLKRMVDAERRKTQELAEANARLAILDRLKMDFLAFIAHELRTPLSGMVVLDLLDPYSDPQTLEEMIDILRRGYVRLEGFVEKGLEYFKWLAAESNLDQSAMTDMADIIHTAVASMPHPQRFDVVLEHKNDLNPFLVRGEGEHLLRVVEILLQNALKFSEEDQRIHLYLASEKGNVRLAITDHGRGFTPEMGPELLRPFTIAHIMNHSQGTGLSLALARAIVTAYGGKIAATSEGVGRGATFTITLPSVSFI